MSLDEKKYSKRLDTWMPVIKSYTHAQFFSTFQSCDVARWTYVPSSYESFYMFGDNTPLTGPGIIAEMGNKSLVIIR
jgi:hypothetical protein